MRRVSQTMAAVLATILASTVSLAQTPPVTPPRPSRAAQPAAANRENQPPRAPRAGPAGAPSGPAFGGPATNLLRMHEQLALTDEQVKKLEALQAVPRPRLNEADMLRARADLMDATKGDVNLEKARAAFDRMARIHTDAQVAQLKSRQDARNVLTADQRVKFDAFAANMRDRRGAGMRGQQFRGQGQGNRQRQGRGPNGPPDGDMGMGPGMGPGMGQGMGPGMMGQGMGPGMGMMGPGMSPQRVMPPKPPTDSIR